MSQPYPLDYTFIAHALNGTIITQTQEDTSLISPTGSAYTDVMANLPLKTFALMGKGHIFSVDFEDGSISVDGRKFYAPRPPDKNTVKPIYYRLVTQVASSDLEKKSSHLRYFIGWQAIHRGKNYKFELGID